MKKINICFLFIILCLLSAAPLPQIRAQTTHTIKPEDVSFGEFRVLLSNDRETNYSVGQRFLIEQNVRVRSSRYIVLIHHSGGMIEINKGGYYKIQDLKEQLLAYQAQAQKKQVTLQINNKKKLSYIEAMYPTGLPVFRCKFHHLRFLMPHKSSTFNPKINVVWKQTTSGKPGQYKLTLMNFFEEVLDEYYTKKTSHMIDLSAYPGYKENTSFLLKIEQGPKDAESVALICPPENMAKQTLKQFYKLNKQQNKGMIQQLLEIFYLKKNGLLFLARGAFQRLISQYSAHKMLHRGFVQFEIEAGFRESFYHLRALKIDEKSIFDHK